MSILSELQNRQIGLIELVSMGFYIYSKNPKLFLITYLTIVPFGIGVDVLQAYISIPWLALALLWNFLLLIYLHIFMSVLLVIYSIITEDLVLGKETNLKNAVRRVRSRLPVLIGLNIRFTVTFSFSFVLLIVPSIIYSVNNGYYDLAFVLRDQRGRAAFAYSRSFEAIIRYTFTYSLEFPPIGTIFPSLSCTCISQK